MAEKAKPRRKPTEPEVVINLDGEPDALIALADVLGEIAADLWLDGKLDLD